jgi:YVTN family beta-propeller protein
LLKTLRAGPAPGSSLTAFLRCPGNSGSITGMRTTTDILPSQGSNPVVPAVNPVTNKIYVTNLGSANVTVIDGATQTVKTTLSAGTQPYAAAVNPITNKVYVANLMSPFVTVIDGATDTVEASVPVAAGQHGDLL